MRAFSWLNKFNIPDDQGQMTLVQLWREFLPLSLSDVTMALGDPLMNTTLAHLPDARMNLAGVGIARSLAVFFESPIIMILHASNALASSQASRSALWRFVLLSGGVLSLALTIMGLPFVFDIIGNRLLGIPEALSPTVKQVLILVGLWPFAIAWRRYFQGLLIHHGQSKAVAQASLWRLSTVASIFCVGYLSQTTGAVLAGLALILGVIVEAIAVTVAANHYDVLKAPTVATSQSLPTNIPTVFKFYWPLANSMLVVWGGRALLLSIIARSVDSALALAAWPVAWGLILVIANSTRMVQQIVIKYRGKTSDQQLLKFALTAGGLCSLVLLFMSTTPMGYQVLQSFIGDDPELANRIKPVLLLCSLIPLMVAVQNATQGFLVSEGRTGRVNLSTWLGTGTLLATAGIGVRMELAGATAAAIAMLAAMTIEVGCLLWQRRS
jgi:progressive ankylosis protein